MTFIAKEFQKVVGTRPIRPDGVDKVTGRANFGADMVMPGMLWGKVKRSPHAHARILSINTEKAKALPGVKAVITWEDFPAIASEEAFVGEGPMNFRDLSRNCMARERALYDGHAVAAVAAISPAIAEQACELIEVDYHVLPHVIDVEEAMKPDAPVAARRPLYPGRRAQADPALEHRQAGGVRQGRHRGRVPRGRCHDRAALYDQAGASGLYRAACLRRLDAGDGQCTIWSSSQGQFMVRAYCAKLLGHRHLRHPRDPGRDRRRVRRQDARLSRAAGAGAGQEIRPAGQDGDEPRRGVPRHRADLGRGHRGQDRRQEGRAHRRRRPRAQIPGRRLSGLAGRAGLHVRLCHVRHPERQHRRLRRRLEPAEGRGLSRAGRADLVVRRRKLHRRTGRPARHRPAGAAREERGQGRHQGGARADLRQYRLCRDRRRGQEPPASAAQARPQPGPRRRLRASGSTSAASRVPRCISTRTAPRWSCRATRTSAARAPRSR